ncbi:MAG TPA: RNA 2',3'-cyclic phosphodiesterase [Elusimicrobiota bacterium]|nr:RNA 2',3'-cyclic phosphodiesterase [Elusimicrobiota bacterium]
MTRLRLFIAISSPVQSHAAVAGIRQELEPRLDKPRLSGNTTYPASVRWTPPSQQHFTLKFLGETDARWVDPIVDALKNCLSDQASFDIECKGLGVFPDEQHARILWIGTGRGGDTLSTLAGKTEDGLARIGLPRADRPFEPHLTIARFKRPVNASSMDAYLSSKDRLFLSFPVSKVSLFKSDLRADGPIHTELAAIPLS